MSAKDWYDAMRYAVDERLWSSPDDLVFRDACWNTLGAINMQCLIAGLEHGKPTYTEIARCVMFNLSREDMVRIAQIAARRQPPGRRASTHRMCAVYRHYDKHGRLLYVGESVAPGKRWKGHRAAASWWTETALTLVTYHHSKEAARIVEASAITHEQPSHNRNGGYAQPDHALAHRQKRTLGHITRRLA